MKLLLPAREIQSLKACLRRAGSRETGGLLMGEQLAPDEFRVAEFSSSRRRGSIASFTRDMRAHRRTLEEFFRKTGREFRRFNYLGEWHSHPHFSVIPSGSDVAAMHAIVNDHAVGATFATLLIVRLRHDDRLEIGSYLFVPGNRRPYPIECMVLSEKTRSAAEMSGREDPVSPEQMRAATAGTGIATEVTDGCGC